MKKTRKHYAIFLVFLIAALVFSLAAPMYAEAHGRDTHASMASYARMLAINNLVSNDQMNIPEWMEEIVYYVPDEVCPVNPTLCDLDEYYDITVGAANEDELDHIWNHLDACVTITHFWDPDEGPDGTMDTAVCHFSDPNAYAKASRFWGMALGQYYMGNKAVAYEYLGHIVHLLGDMCVPGHAHEDMHVYDDTYDDEFFAGEYGATNEDGLTPQYLSLNERIEIQNAGLIDLGLVPAGMHPLYYLFYTAAQRAGYYPCDGTGANNVDALNLVDFGALEDIGAVSSSDLDDCDDFAYNTSADCGQALWTIRRNTYFYGIRAIATLYKVFAEVVKRQAETTLVLDSLTNVDQTGSNNEPGAPEFFTRVYLGGYDTNGTPFGLWYRNEGDMILDLDQGETSFLGVHGGVRGNGWAFAHNVGMEGAARIEIELWDDDGSPAVHDFQLWDICSGPQEPEDDEQRRVWLDINLNACREGGNAISLDVTGPCRTQLITQGDDDPHAMFSFRVLPPNTPPTADAGEDQMVNEGDIVLLQGSFTDPDPEDTHDYLWEMVSSTNGQVVPDSSASSKTFKPCDNGVYTFRFTVTDNHGAWDSDEVVVTVTNVSPVVTALSISNQPNAEFILPVVHVVSFAGFFTDAGSCDTHTAVWDWSDGPTFNGLVTEADGSGSVTGSHDFSIPGDFTVTLTVTDDDGGSGSNSMSIHIADVGEALDIFNAYILSLPASMFKNNADHRKNGFDNMFFSLDAMLASLDYQGMIKSMNTNIRTKFDGLVGGIPRDDWIIQDLATQTELCQKVDDITSYLQYLLSTMP